MAHTATDGDHDGKAVDGRRFKVRRLSIPASVKRALWEMGEDSPLSEIRGSVLPLSGNEPDLGLTDPTREEVFAFIQSTFEGPDKEIFEMDGESAK